MDGREGGNVDLVRPEVEVVREGKGAVSWMPCWLYYYYKVRGAPRAG